MTTAINRFRRPTQGARIAGLCAGFAERYGFDVATVRIAWIFITLFTGILPGVLTYLVAWFVVPSSDEPPTQ